VPELVACLSPERFQTYLDAVGGADHVAGLRRYLWNAAVAARFHGPLHLTEVTLRNAVHTRMTHQYGAAWYDLNHLGGQETQAIADAKQYLTARGDPLTPGKIIAELRFSFWVSLFANRYSALWKTDLGRLFTPRRPRADVHDDLDRLRTLRNRIAHHEPIFRRNLLDDLARARRIVEGLSPHMADWLNWHQRADAAFGMPDDEVGAF
jgi:hypothetical protein